jgi:hypothetical protein
MTEILARPMTLDEFAPLVGGEILLDSAPEPVRITLVQAEPLPHDGHFDRPPFALTFRSAPDALLVDGAYTMRAAGLEAAAVFISSLAAPIDAPAGYYYQAIFN